MFINKSYPYRKTIMLFMVKGRWGIMNYELSVGRWGGGNYKL
jgi:hypothetical protein